jgi:hypothetical protein
MWPPKFWARCLQEMINVNEPSNNQHATRNEQHALFVGDDLPFDDRLRCATD